MRRNELDTLLENIESEARRRSLAIFHAQPIWDDDHLTTIHWQTREGVPSGWQEFLDVAQTRKVQMLLLIVHSFHEAAFEPSPPAFRMHLDPETRAELEEQEHLLLAAREFSGQTGRIEVGWIDGDIFYQWGQETDWYGRVWELVMSRPFEGLDDDDEDEDD
jgi:hypothetical protein